MRVNKKAITLAQDVIQYLETEKFVPDIGNFCAVDVDYEKNHLLKDVLHRALKCKICADGALCAARVLRYNGLLAKELDKTYINQALGYIVFTFQDVRRILRGYFSLKQIQLIEIAYELGDGYFGSLTDKKLNIGDWRPQKLNQDEWNAAYRFGKRYAAGLERMIAIMKNIIKNCGYFCPSRKLQLSQ